MVVSILQRDCNLKSYTIFQMKTIYLHVFSMLTCSLSLSTPGLSLNSIAYGCPRIKKIFLASMRCLVDYHLEPFLKNCPLIEQVDVLGSSVTPEIISRYCFCCCFSNNLLTTELTIQFCHNLFTLFLGSCGMVII